MQKVIHSCAGIHSGKQASRAAGCVVACVLFVWGGFQAQPSIAGTTPAVVLSSTADVGETRSDASFASPRHESSRLSDASHERHQGLRRALVSESALQPVTERKKLSREERSALQRELREAVRGVNESRPLASSH